MRARGLPPPPSHPSNPRAASAAACAAARVWAPPRSLAATRGILSSPRGTEMFQFPRCPPRINRGARPSRRAGCPIRGPPDRRPPAPPRGVSPRGRALPRPAAPRHPPCAQLRGPSLFLARPGPRRGPGAASRPRQGARDGRGRAAPPPGNLPQGGTAPRGPPRRPPAPRRPGAFFPRAGSGPIRACCVCVCGRDSAGRGRPARRLVKVRAPRGGAPRPGGSRPAAGGPRAPRGGRWARLDSNQGPRPYQGRALTA